MTLLSWTLSNNGQPLQTTTLLRHRQEVYLVLYHHHNIIPQKFPFTNGPKITSVLPQNGSGGGGNGWEDHCQ